MDSSFGRLWSVACLAPVGKMALVVGGCVGLGWRALLSSVRFALDEATTVVVDEGGVV